MRPLRECGNRPTFIVHVLGTTRACARLYVGKRHNLRVNEGGIRLTFRTHPLYVRVGWMTVRFVDVVSTRVRGARVWRTRKGSWSSCPLN